MATVESNSGTKQSPRWLHWLAVATVIWTLPLLTLGAEVTTKKVGMVDQAPLRSPLHLFQVIFDTGGIGDTIQEMGLGWIIEHGHRTVSWTLGFVAIGLAICLTKYESRRWLRVLGWAVPFAILGQGILGALRVDMHERFGPTVGGTVALIHGCTAQLVFAFLVCVAVWTSSGWQHLTGPANAGVRRASLVLVGIMYLQIVFGAVMRHKELALGTRTHILLAFAVVAAAIWAGLLILQSQEAGNFGKRSVFVLWGLLAVQLMLGLETMLSKFTVQWGYTGERVEPAALTPDLIRSFHFLLGAMTFSAAVAIVVIAHRQFAFAVRPVPAPSHHLEGAL